MVSNHQFEQYSIVPYERARHEKQAFSLWSQVYDRKWSIGLPRFQMSFPEKCCFVAVSSTNLLGFVGTMPSDSALTAIFVRRDCHRHGIGTRLFNQALMYLRSVGAETVTVGGLPMLWKGVPEEFKAALHFFAEVGCDFKGEILDQYCYLDDFKYPQELNHSLIACGMKLCLAKKADADRIIRFQKNFFPHWTPLFLSAMQKNGLQTIACIKRGNDILGTVLIGRLGVTAPGVQWELLASKGFGSVATLGVAPDERGKRLGFALFAYATKCVQESGAKVCFLNYSEAPVLYRKFGFLDWSQYRRFEITL
ncbi:GNAT family N-acetyltransferase [Mycetohabitans endofungorum]|uniref:GNAT family N-acetyltransferase n=1 Tax=Mycetohabitans endofungorum TaxID=417203 RepID=UPI0030D4AD2A